MKYLKEIIKFLYYKVKLRRKKFFIRSGSKVEGAKIIGGGHLGKNSDIRDSIVEYGSYIGSDCNLFLSKIGKYCSLGNKINIVRGNHPSRKYVSTSPAFYSDALKKEGMLYKNYIKYPLGKETKKGFSAEIGNDVWIGENVTILGGVTIGDGAIIGAGAVVVKDVEPYSIVGGVPAKEIRKRFSDDEIEFLKKLKWWDKDKKWLEDNVEFFSDIKLMKQKYENLYKV